MKTHDSSQPPQSTVASNEKQKKQSYSKYIFTRDAPYIKNISDTITISNVTTLKELKTFYEIPWTLYSNDINWIAPFWSETRDFFKTKNPFWTHAETQLFIAKKQGKPIWFMGVKSKS